MTCRTWAGGVGGGGGGGDYLNHLLLDLVLDVHLGGSNCGSGGKCTVSTTIKRCDEKIIIIKEHL